MKYNIKVLIAIVLLVIIIPINGILLLKILNNQNNDDLITQKKCEEIENNLFLIGEAVKIINQRPPLKLEVKDATQNSSLTATASANLNINKNLKLLILNATNITGKANAINEKIKSASLFTDITLGNAPATTSSVFQSKKTFPTDIYQKVINLLKNDLPNFKEEALTDTETSDLIIIIGKNL